MNNLAEETKINELMVSKENISSLHQDIYADEYPMIWYEPHINSEEKKALKAFIEKSKSIHFFSVFRDAFEFAESLGISFLLIISSNIEEQKLFEDFGALKDTFGRRLFDIEEEAAFEDFKEGITTEDMGSLKAYVFMTRGDFENEAPENDDEEEVMLMCDVKEISKQFREEFTTIWCDPEMSNGDKETIMKELDIEEKNIYTDFDILVKKLEKKDIEAPYHLILSGRNEVEVMVTQTKDLKDLLCLYIYGDPSNLDKLKSRKIKIGETLEKLLPKIKEGIRTQSKYRNTFPAFATDFDGWDKSYVNKVHYYLRGFVNFRNRNQAKGDFIKLAKIIYHSKNLIQFEKEYFGYSKEQILRWYTEESPIYKLINNCLRISTSDSIQYCRFLLKDLETAIKEEYKQEPKKFNGAVYRAAYISNDEVEKLERNIGKEIEMYGFLSTSVERSGAVNFLNTDIEKKVLITIVVPPFPDPELDEQGFADLAKFSNFSNEKEILFNVRSRFQVLEVGKTTVDEKNPKSQECRHLVLFYGAHLLRKYMTMKKPSISFGVQRPQEFICNHCKSDNNLFAFGMEGTKIICKICLLKGLIPKNTLILPINKKHQEINKINLKGKILEFDLSKKLNEFYGYRCHDCFGQGKEMYYKWINTESEDMIIQCVECFKKEKEERSGYLLISEKTHFNLWINGQTKWEEADTKFQTNEFEILEKLEGASVFFRGQDYVKCEDFSTKFLKNNARKRRREQMKLNYFVMIGKVSLSLGENEKALEAFTKILNIRKAINGETHHNTATSYGYLGQAYEKLGKYQYALKAFTKGLDIRKAIYGENHSYTANSYSNLASVCHSLEKYQEAFDYHLIALEITKSTFGETHPDVATSNNNLALVFESWGKYQNAFDCFSISLNINKAIYGEKHPETATSLLNISGLYHILEKYGEAKENAMKALEIRKSIYGEEHPAVAYSYCNLADMHIRSGDHQGALEYLTKSSNIIKLFDKEKHPETANLYNNLAGLYRKMGKFQQALEYNMKALAIFQSVYGERHSHTAIAYGSIAEVYAQLGRHQEALEYHMKALTIFQAVFGETHHHTATSYTNLTSLYENLGENQKALEYAMKSLEIRKVIFGESHSETATILTNIGVFYCNLGKLEEALKYHMKALAISTLINGENHSNTANSIHCIALLYEKQGKLKEALEHNNKALALFKSIYGEIHPLTATSYNNLAGVYDSLKNYKLAHEYLIKSLNIRKSIYGDKHPEIAVSLNNIGFVCMSLNRPQEALEHFLKSWNLLKSIYGEKHPQTIIAYANIAVWSRTFGNIMPPEFIMKISESLASQEQHLSIGKFENSQNDSTKLEEISEILGKRSAPQNFDENFEPDVEKKIKE